MIILRFFVINITFNDTAITNFIECETFREKENS